MAEQGPLSLFLGRWAKAVFAEAGSNKLLTVQGKIVSFDANSVVFERTENMGKTVRIYVTRDRISHIKQDVGGQDE